MTKIVIFDFFRTLYDPDNDALLEGATQVLEGLKKRGFELFIVSHGAGRKEELQSLGIDHFFKDVVVTTEKTEKDFLKVIPEGTDKTNSFVIGDRVRYEIKIGNILGFQTIWLKLGKFSVEKPQSNEEKPDFTILSLKEILKIAP
ncbi:MAG: hypothetical protein A3F33_01360 [Candidatus Woykebacteria bacterium RIFCSPHIGHO2_12_FULL_43_10]|uniref:HAD family hydrolase n=1 Tax=Candidatus Woykebacteria bacterium RIFCSPLOWO2_01_FULL_43_14 TaxID=1802605 RepID=A0A1G1WST8_9BACT|nr:MAG: hypothetical protein A2802_00220 [Candidatus Woykebacteria bacterium RIFCSPHIGHO2_01_FULL_43_29]OGY30406.1 MAG: hypothetical protein A3F33_01360 [Candidatus Woykebacteria bacterium RIFCSPHIGHO2_12_FULL_43_10]OGY30808.1 MAG: hypothetical protein A3A61_00070 [Candidatus Woykebacteria bacterium RIFCSPLOWO2_01_FULL_43_14]